MAILQSEYTEYYMTA